MMGSKGASLVAVMVGFLISASAQAQMLGAADQTPIAESQVPGDLQYVSWDIMLNDSGVAALKKTANPITTASHVFEGYSCAGSELLQCLSDAMDNNGVENVTQYMNFPYSFNNQMFLNQGPGINYYNPIQRNGPSLNANGTTDDSCKRVGDKIHLKLNETNYTVQFNTNRRTPVVKQPPASISYEGDLLAGDTVLFIWPITGPNNTPYYIVKIYETFKSYEFELPVVQCNRDGKWWIKNGPAGARKSADIAAVWESHADHNAGEKLTPAFDKTTSDGQHVQLVAISRRTDAPYCWWDAQGNPVKAGQVNQQFNGESGAGLSIQMRLTQTGAQATAAYPATQPFSKMPGQQMGNAAPSISDYGTVVPDGQAELKAGVPAGKWEPVAQLNVNESKDVDSINFKMFNPVNQNEQGFAIEMSSSAHPLDTVYAFTAVNAAGKEGQTWQQDQGIAFDNMYQGSENSYLNFEGMQYKDVQYFQLYKRKREWVTFSGFAAAPNVPVKTDISPDEFAPIAAAFEAKQQQQRQAMVAPVARGLRAMQINQWKGIAADPSKQMGMLKALVDDAGKGDEKAVRALLTSDNPADVPTLDALAHYLTISQSNWEKMVTNFGQEKSLDSIDKPANRNFAAMFLDTNFKKDADGTWNGDHGFIIKKGANNQFILDFTTLFKEQKDFADQLKSKIVGAEAVAKVLAQPGATMDQVTAAEATK